MITTHSTTVGTRTSFRSWRSFLDFQLSVRQHLRYVRSPDGEDFLQAVLATAEKRQLQVEQEELLYRAQLGEVWREQEDGAEFPEAYPPERMKPLPDRAHEGRANPKGIPCLYLATTLKTAASEVRPWIGSYVSIGVFKIVRNLTLVNCSHNYGDPVFSVSFPKSKPATPEEAEKMTWANIDRAFSEPTDVSEDTAHYAATQVISELFKRAGYDGIAYRSNFGGGHNVALFDLDAAEITQCQLHTVDAVEVSVSAASNPYFMKARETDTSARRQERPFPRT